MRISINCSFLISILCSISLLKTISSLKSMSHLSLSERFEEEFSKNNEYNSRNENEDNFQKRLMLLAQMMNNKNATTTTTKTTKNTATTKTQKNTTVSTKAKKNVTKTAKPQNKTTAAASAQTPKAAAGSAESDKKLKEMQEQQKKMQGNVQAIEKEVKSVGAKIEKQMNTSIEINKTVTKALEITKNLSKKIDMNQLKTEMKLNIINKHVIEQLRNQLYLQYVRIQNDIVSQQKKVEMLNLQITDIKSKLPNTNAICGKLNNCGSCTANPKCGWCSLTQTCVEGNEKGPLDGSCTFYDYQVCSAPRECGTYKKCGVSINLIKDCIKDVACGWCDKSGFPLCMNKNDAEKGGCRSDNFIHQWRELNKCPKVTLVNII